MANKVLMGMKELHIGTYTVNDDGSVTMGAPYHQKGAVGYSPEEQGENYTFYADDSAYYSSFTSGIFEGDLVVAMFDDTFKKNFLGYVELDDGGLAQIKNAKKPNVWLAFEITGDAEKTRVIFYNGTLGGITREYATIEDSEEVQTATVSTRFIGDNKTGITKVEYVEGDAGYETLFDNPPAPTLPTSSDS